MTVMNSSAEANASEAERIAIEEAEKKDAAENMENDGADEDDGIFSAENLKDESEEQIQGKEPMKIGPEDKASFIDAVAENRRFTKRYVLFGGKIDLTLRSLTADEVNAIGTWIARQGTKDSAGMLAGRYRKYLMCAHVAMLNGVEMPPIEEPLFETVGKDGKTIQPGWIGRSSYFDGIGYGQFSAIMSCISSFDTLYSILCSKAEDSNFWLPDTH